MAKGYVIASIEVTDPDQYPAYVRQVLPTIEAFDGRFLVRGGAAASFENQPFGDRHVVIEFPSVTAARAWYDSDLYAPLKALRQSASHSVQTIAEGVT